MMNTHNNKQSYPAGMVGYFMTEEQLRELAERSAARAVELFAGSVHPAPAKEPEDEWGSRQEAADVIRCSLPTLHGLISSGLVQTTKVGRRTICNLSDLRRKLETGEVSKYRKPAKYVK